MYCKKCGTEQREGQKFCPKCGERFLDAKNKLSQEERKSEKPEALNGESPTIDDLVQQGKKFIDEKVRPQLSEKIDTLKKNDWDEKKNETVKDVHNFFNDINKLSTVSRLFAVISVLCFFVFKHGFSTPWIWWLCAIAFVIAALYIVNQDKKSGKLNKARRSFGIIVVIGLVFLFYSPRSSSTFGDIGDGNLNIETTNQKEEETLLKMANIRNEIKSILPQVERLYKAHQQHMARGFVYAGSPAWGRWQNCRDRINRLWDEYIRLAQKLDDNEQIIEEARNSKRKMDDAICEMFGPRL